MRFLNGVVVGLLLAVGLAYAHDRSVGEEPGRQLVNWEEFGRTAATAEAWLRDQFDDIARKLQPRN